MKGVAPALWPKTVIVPEIPLTALAVGPLTLRGSGGRLDADKAARKSKSANRICSGVGARSAAPGPMQIQPYGRHGTVRHCSREDQACFAQSALILPIRL